MKTDSAVVVCLSGGVDSALLCAMAGKRLIKVVFVDYGQPARFKEYTAAQAVADRFGVQLFKVQIDCLDLGSMQRLDGACVVPNRNAILLSIASNHAPAGSEVWIGCNANDYENYSDCRPRFIESIGAVLNRKIVAPLLSTKKPAIIAAAQRAGIFDVTWSCYGASEDQCGKCDSCKENQTGDNT